MPDKDKKTFESIPVSIFSRPDNYIYSFRMGFDTLICVAMCFCHFGIKADSPDKYLIDQLSEQAYQNGWRITNAEDIKKLIESYSGFVHEFITNASLQDIRDALDEWVICIVLGNFPGTFYGGGIYDDLARFGHAILIRGYDESNFYVNDPWLLDEQPDGISKSDEGLQYSNQFIVRCCSDNEFESINEIKSIWMHKIYRV